MNASSDERLGTLPYGVKTVHFIRQALAGFAGGEAIVSEMVQNADDAGATKIRFTFTPDALIVFNDSHFTDGDFRNIGAIASGGKRDNEGKIGTWGIGFLSVYHITDAPELESAGRRVVFDPYQNELPYDHSEVIQGTRFRLPWRKKPSELSQEIEARTWSRHDIVQLQTRLETDIYSLVLFTRHVTKVEVFIEDRILAEVSRSKIKEEHFDNFQVETWDITYKTGNQPPRSYPWLCYRTQVPVDFTAPGVTIKDHEVRFAFPIKSSKWLEEQVPNVLYNFLPTPIQTGLPFQTNGAFFPDNNRNTILLDRGAHPERAKWNWNVLDTLGALFLNAIYDLRDRVTKTEPIRRFYELLPLVGEAYEVGRAVARPFLERAGKQEIVWTSLSEWAKPREVYVNQRGSRLPELVSEYMPVLPTGKDEGAPQTFKDFLTDGIEPQRDRAPWLRWAAVFDFLQRNVSRDVALADAHAMINTREKLEALYKLLEKEKIGAEDRDNLRLTRLCLCEDGRLRRFKDVQWLEQSAQALLPRGHGIPLVDAILLHKFSDSVKDLTDAFRGKELVHWFQRQTWPSTPFGPGTTPLVHDTVHLRNLLRFIQDDLDRVHQNELGNLPLVLTEDEILRRRGPSLFMCDDEAVRRALARFGFTFVHIELATDVRVHEVYEHMGVVTLSPQAVIKGLGARTEAMSDEDLIALYDYFYRHQKQLQEDDKKRLRALPLYRTQQGRLVPLERDSHCLLLPPVQRLDDAEIAVLDKLGLDNTIHSHLASREIARRFLTWLGAKERDRLTLIREEILPHYRSENLNHDDRLTLLRYISDSMRHYAEQHVKPEGLPQLWQQLKTTALIRCADGKYREGDKVNFAGPLFDRVFSGDYRRPHPQYEIPIAREGDADQTPYTQSPWHWFFQGLDVNTTPTDADLVRVVENITQEGSPTPERVQTIQRIYTYLNEELQAHLLDRREGLRRLARIEWLPARGNEERWYRPAVMYPASYENLIGEQAPLLPFRDPSVPLRALLGMRVAPPVELVAQHLLASAVRGTGVPDRVYQYLGRGWDDLPEKIKKHLQQEPVIWEAKGQRYWTADKTFLGDRRKLYGARRLSVLDPPGGEIQHFFLRIGVKSNPQPWEDGVALLREIASDYADGRSVCREDLHLVHAQFDDLGYLIDHPAARRPLTTLRTVAFVPDTAGRLLQPECIALADRPTLLEHFPEGEIPLVSGSDKRDKPESDLTQSGVRFLKAVGVAPLSRLVRRHMENVQSEGEDEALSIKLQHLTRALQRIYITHTGEAAKTRFDPLLEVQAWRCSQLTVRYVLENGSGWRVNGNVGPTTALYVAKAKRLYFEPERDGNIPLTAVARELNRDFFPERTVSPTIELLLLHPLHEWDSYLDKHDFDQVHRTDVADVPEQGAATTFSASPEEPLLFSGEVPNQPDTHVDTSKDEQAELELSGDGVGFHRDSVSQNQLPTTADESWGADTSKHPEKASATTDDNTNETVAVSPSATSTEKFPANVSDSAPDEKQREEEETTNVSRSDRLTSKEKAPSHTSEDKNGVPQKEKVPAFTGQLQPPVIQLPNNYSALRELYGFPKSAKTQNPASKPAPEELADETWQQVKDGEESDNDRITQVRFTLHYYPRYQGFLKLHARARKMLADRPSLLRCRTDYDSEFDLYADYEQGILYNRKVLPAFFDSYNIPAGGIVYLERMHGNTVRLFWEKTQTVINDVIRYEATRDGSVEKFVVANNEYGCEVNEAVYRAETRFEDPEAFFLHAKDKEGVLATVCHAFGKPGRVLPYIHVLKAVLQERPTAEATVRWLLHQLDCFVQVEDDQWKFVPENGLGTLSSGNGRTTRPEPPIPQEDGQRLDRGEVEKSKLTDPIAVLLADALHKLAAEVQRLRDSGAKPRETLQQLIGSLRDLLRRLEEDLAASPSSSDEQLDELWRSVQEQPSGHAAQQKLVAYLFAQLQAAQPTSNVVLQAIQFRVEHTPEVRRAPLYKVLTTLADQARQTKLLNAARELYRYLQTQNAGDFRRQIEDLEQTEALNHAIDQAEQAQDHTRRWQLLSEAWQQHRGATALRKAVISALLRDGDEMAREVEKSLAGIDVSSALAVFETWRALLHELEDAWRESDEAVAVIGPMVRRLFFASIEKARAQEQVTFYGSALRVAALAPTKRAYLNADELLEAAEEVANVFEEQADVVASASLMEYAWHRVDAKAVSAAVAYRYNERLSTLWERLNQFHLALIRLQEACEIAPSAHQRNRLAAKLRDLEDRTKHIDQEEEKHRLRDEFQRLVRDESFMTVVSPASFAELRRHYQ